MRNKTHLEIEGDKLFRKKVISDVYTILTIASGQSLLQQIFGINIEGQIKIKLNNDGVDLHSFIADFEKKKKISSCVSGFPEKDLSLFKVHQSWKSPSALFFKRSFSP